MAHLLRTILVCLLIGAVLCASTGISLVPLRKPVASASDEWFPCKDHGCGCISAEMCRTHCCCRKPAPTPKPARKSCCAHESADVPAQPQETSASHSSGTSWHLVIQSASCSGRDSGWLMKSVAWTFQFHQCEIPPSTSVEWVEVAGVTVPSSLSLPPEPLPPRGC